MKEYSLKINSLYDIHKEVRNQLMELGVYNYQRIHSFALGSLYRIWLTDEEVVMLKLSVDPNTFKLEPYEYKQY